MKTFLLSAFCFLLLPALASPPGWSPGELARAQPAEAAAGGGTTPAWQDIATEAEADTTGTVGYNDAEWSSLVASQSGSSTKARIYVHFRYGACDVKMALYDSAGTTLLASGTASSVGNAQYLEVTWGTPYAVTASTTYKLAWQAQNANLENRYLAGSGSMSYGANTYASFPPSALPTDVGPATRKLVVSLWIE